MRQLQDLIGGLPERHKRALSWFMSNSGTEVGWPGPLEDGILVATLAKGIYKPEWSEYALSVKQILNGPYPDRLPNRRPDGTWTYDYYQENANPADRDKAFTNVGLMKCVESKVPVGVMVQVADKPEAKYHIWGLALVTRWKEGFFLLEGFSSDGFCHEPQGDSGSGSIEHLGSIWDRALESNFPSNILGDEVEIGKSRGRVTQVLDDGAAFELLDFGSRQKKKFITKFIVEAARSKSRTGSEA